jgi:predicted RNase H-like HicB family nuclease
MSIVRITADLIPEEEGGFTVYCPELDIYTQGETEEECLDNLREAAELHLEELGASTDIRKVIRRELEVQVGALTASGHGRPTPPCLAEGGLPSDSPAW